MLHSTQPCVVYKGLVKIMMNDQNKLNFRPLIILVVLVILLTQTSKAGISSPQFQEEPIYIVQSGDTLNSIALRFGISADDLLSANDIPDPNALNIGQRLVIPGLEGISGVLTSEVLPFGISLTSLTRQYDLDQSDLVSLNRITSPSEIIAGIKFIIPINENLEPLNLLAYVPRESTLLEMAVKGNTSPWWLIEQNKLAATWDLIPGEYIYGIAEDETQIPALLGANQIFFNNLPVIQGETLQIGINIETPADFSGSFDDETLHFFNADPGNYYGFHGIHALSEPGPRLLQISATFADDTQQSFDQLVLLAEGGYGSEWVNVPEEYLDEAVIAEEDAYLQPVLGQVTPQRHWEGRFQYPVDEPCVNSGFGQRRDYNNGGLFFYHTGMDFAVCAQNLNIYAPAAGEIVLTEELTIKGKAVLIDHGWGVFSGYWHLSEFNVNEGDFVQPGDLIGQIGDTGRSAGPHLHFEININGTPVNPETWLTQEFPEPVP